MQLFRDALINSKYMGLDNKLPSRSRKNRRRQANKRRRQQGRKECADG
jgi:hypothetical protein